MSRAYILMHKGVEVRSADFDEDSGRIIGFIKVLDIRHMLLGTVVSDHPNNHVLKR